MKNQFSIFTDDLLIYFTNKEKLVTFSNTVRSVLTSRETSIDSYKTKISNYVASISEDEITKLDNKFYRNRELMSKLIIGMEAEVFNMRLSLLRDSDPPSSVIESMKHNGQRCQKYSE